MTKIGMKRKEPKKPMKKKLPKDYLLDNLWSKVVRALAGNRCVLCGEDKKQIHAHHWVGKRYKATRWLIENGLSACHNCHQDIHDLPGFKQDVIKKTIGTDRLEQLELKALHREKPDKEAIKKQLQEKLKEMPE